MIKYQIYKIESYGVKCDTRYGVEDHYEINLAHKLVAKWNYEDRDSKHSYEVREIKTIS